MASINSITGSLSSTSSLRGYGGLSSGLDRDTLIEQLTYATRTKIENQKAKQTRIEWQQTAMRSIIDKAYNFTNKYMSYSSSTNIMSSSFFARNNITASGENSKYLTVSGTASSAELMSVVGVKQLAENARIAGSTASTATLTTGEIDFSKDIQIDNLKGKFISVKYGGTVYSADLGGLDLEQFAKGGADADAALQDVLNDAFKDVELSDGKTLNQVLSASVTDGKVSFAKNTSNSLEITGGTALAKLGFVTEGDDADNLDFSEGAVGGSLDARTSAVTTQNAAAYMAGKTMTFSYNGTSKTITLGTGITDVASLQQDLQEKLNSAFGKGRIAVGTDGNALTFRTTLPDSDNDPLNNTIDTTSTLSITGGASGLFGANGALGIETGISNRVDLSKSLSESGLAGAGGLTPNADGKYELTINGKDFAFESTATVQEIIDTINNDKDLNVTISYQSNSDRFIISSNENGASGYIDMSGSIADALFGADTDKFVQGKDAIIAVQYAGDSTVTEIRRDTNSVSMDGLTIGIKGTFGYDEDGNRIAGTEAVSFEAKADTDKIIEGIKSMIADYNELVDLLNSELKTKPDSDYSLPLTASQKEDMSDDEIEDYESIAKQGLLYGDNDLRMFANALRYALPSADIFAFSEIGITESTEYSDNGKLVLDEEKLRAALESDPEKVSDLFTRKSGVDEDGNQVSAGFMANLNDILNRYTGTVGATKGLLVQRAGSEHSPLSLLENTMKTEIDNISDYLETLLERLEAEEDRYISQFTTLETLISQMNNQSSYISSLSSY